MNDIKLSERVREEYYISGSEDFCVQQFVLADEIAALEQRIAELEAGQQAAIDEALSNLIKYTQLVLIPDSEDHHYYRGASFVITCIQQEIRRRISTNPLAELQAKVRELEADNAELRADAEQYWCLLAEVKQDQ